MDERFKKMREMLKKTIRACVEMEKRITAIERAINSPEYMTQDDIDSLSKNDGDMDMEG